jgi:hypothetical protein
MSNRMINAMCVATIGIVAYSYPQPVAAEGSIENCTSYCDDSCSFPNGGQDVCWARGGDFCMFMGCYGPNDGEQQGECAGNSSHPYRVACVPIA